jgi:hypothetical protein
MGNTKSVEIGRNRQTNLPFVFPLQKWWENMVKQKTKNE